MELEEGEQLKFYIGSNLKRGWEYVGGHLKITNENLYFHPHPINLQRGDLLISMKRIKEVDKAKVLGISPNGVNITLDDDTCYQFVIGMPWTKKREEVINFIEGLIDK